MYRLNQVQKKTAYAKKFIVSGFAAVTLAGFGSAAAFAAQPASPGSYGTAAANAQCGTAAGSGAYADQYGNFGYLGAAGGANGQQTGLNNSSVCGNRQSN